MPPEQTQVPQEDMTPEDAKASLGIATMLQGQLMPQQPVEGDMGAETAPEEELNLEEEEAEPVDPEALKKDIMKEVKSMMKDEIGSIKDMIKEALQDEQN